MRHLRGVTVLGLRDLEVGTDDADPALLLAQDIVEETVEAFRVQQEVRRVDPAMAALRRQVADTADVEIDRLRQDVDGETADVLERSIRRILAKVMHDPSERARHLAQTGQADAYVEAFHTIFGIDISGEGVSAAAVTGGAGAAEDDPMHTAGWMRVDLTVPPSSARDLAQAAVRRGISATTPEEATTA